MVFHSMAFTAHPMAINKTIVCYVATIIQVPQTTRREMRGESRLGKGDRLTNQLDKVLFKKSPLASTMQFYCTNPDFVFIWYHVWCMSCRTVQVWYVVLWFTMVVFYSYMVWCCCDVVCYCCVVMCGMAWYAMVWYGMVCFGMVWYGMVYRVVQYGVVSMVFLWYGISYRIVWHSYMVYDIVVMPCGI